MNTSVFNVAALRHGVRGAFTLLELLVVVAILAVLVALILPAVQSARESARLSACQNNMRQLTAALQNYESVHGALPVGAIVPTFGDNPPRYVTPFCVSLFPFVEETSRHDLYDLRKHWFDQDKSKVGYLYGRLPSWQCPSQPPQTKVTGPDISVGRLPPRPKGNYGINWGADTIGRANSPIFPDTYRNGVFANNFGASLGQITDGTSHTFVLAEVTQSPTTGIPTGTDDMRGDLWNLEGASYQVTAFNTPNSTARDFGVCFDQPDVGAPCRTLPMGNFVNSHLASRSFHPGGVNVGMCDGSVQFIREDIPLALWRALATRAGGEIARTDF